MEITPGDPRHEGAVTLLRAHLAHSRAHSAPDDVHALDIDAFCVPDREFFHARVADRIVGVGALRKLDEQHYEIKSMHIAGDCRGQGVGSADGRASDCTGTAWRRRPSEPRYRNDGCVRPGASPLHHARLRAL